MEQPELDRYRDPRKAVGATLKIARKKVTELDTIVLFAETAFAKSAPKKKESE